MCAVTAAGSSIDIMCPEPSMIASRALGMRLARCVAVKFGRPHVIFAAGHHQRRCLDAR